MKKFLLFIVFMQISIVFVSIQAQNTQVSVFNYPGLNGHGGCSDENENLIKIIDALPDYDLDGSIQSFSDSSLLASQLEASTLFFMTDMETQNPNNTSFFPEASQAVFENWVNNGGVMVMTGTSGSNDTDFLNLIFNWNLTTVRGNSWTKNSTNTSGTPFESVSAGTLPSLSATDAINKNSVPNFTTMWGTDSNAVVAVIEYGAGYVIFMGWDFYSSGPGCSQYSSDWVQQVVPAALQYASELSKGAVDNINYSSADLTYSYSQGGQSYYVVVPADAMAPTAEQIKAGSDYDGVSPVIADNATTTADIPHVFNLSGLTNNTSYDIYVVTEFLDNGAPTFSQVSDFNFTTLANDTPSLSRLANQNVACLNTTSPEQILTMTDEYPGNETFVVTGTSSNTTLVQNSEIKITGTGTTRSIEVSPETDASGSTTITIFVEDSLGAQSSTSFELSFHDKVDPVVITQDITVQLDDTGNASIVTADIDNGSSDNCGIDTMSLDVDSFSCSDIGNPVTVTLAVTDVNGNESSATAMVTVEDNVAPLALVQNISVQLDENGVATITPEQIDNGSKDACGITEMSLDITEFTCENIGDNTVTLTLTDENGNVSEATAKVTIEDNVAPVALAQDITVQLDAEGNATITPAMIDNGSNDACGIAKMSLDLTEFTCENVGDNPVTLTVEDINGNISKATATVTIEDNVAPVALAQDITVQLDAEGNATITPAMIDNGSNDACGIAKMSLDITEFNCDKVGGNTVSLTVEDINGNISKATATVTIEDNVAPVALAQDITVQLDAEGNATITPTMIDNGSNDACGIAKMSLDLTEFTCENIGDNTVTLTLTDENGNKSSATATVSVEDNIVPVVITQNIIVHLDENGVAIISAEQIDNDSSDACGITAMRLDKTEFSCEDLGKNTVNLEVTDVYGNMASAPATVMIVDEQKPAAIAKGIRISLDENGEANITSEVLNDGSFDNCSIAEMSLDRSDFDCDDLGENEVTFTVTDQSGNTDAAVVIVEVEDDTAPVVKTRDVELQMDADGKAYLTAEMIDNGSRDNCSIVLLELDKDEFSCDDLGSNQVNLRVTDASGNMASAVANVIIINEQDLDLVKASLEDIVSECPVSLSDLEIPKAIGLCQSEIEGTTNASAVISESTLITWMFEDESGNQATQTQQIIIEDVSAPVTDEAQLEDIIVECGIENIPAPTATDNCDGTITATTNDPVSYTEQGDYIITWTFTDAAGNSTSQDQFIVVEDLTAPVVQVLDLNVEIDFNDSIEIRPEDIDAGSYDECGEVSLSLDRSYFDEQGSYEVILTVTDLNGNTVQATANVHVSYKDFATTKVHVVPTMLEAGEEAKVIVSEGSLIRYIEVLEVETGKYKVFRGNDIQQMNLDIAPMKGTLLIRVVDNKGEVHLKKLIAL